MATKYLDSSGLSYFWDKLKAFFQEKLVSGTNIKTINSNSVLGSGDISISPDVVYCTCGTAAATAAKVATIVTGSLASLTTGCQAIVKFTNANGVASPTLKVGSTDAKAIRRYGTTAPSTSAASSWNAGSCVLFVYDGSCWYIANYLNSTYSEISVANITNGTGSTTGLVTGRRAKSAVEAFAPVKDVTVGGTSVMNGTTAEVPSIPSVSVSQITSSGTNIADITIDGTTTHLYAPTSGGGFVTDVKVDGTSVVSSGVASIDLTGKSDVGHTHTTSAITDFPSLATVATSGSYNDLSNKPTIPTITDTYSGTSSNGMSGKAVKSAIDALDGTISGSAGAGKTLTAFSQTDGKVSATFGNISITKSQVSDFPTIPSKTSELTNDSNFVSAIDLSDNLLSTLYYLNVSGSTASLVNASSAPISIASLAAAFRSVSGVQIAQVLNVSGSNFKLRMYDIVDGDAINGTVRLVAVEGSTVYIADLTDAGSGLTGTISTTTMLTSETDPTVPSWAKAASKPTYTASEVGALATTGGDIEGDITLKAAAGQSSPSLIFQRGTLTDNYNDWLIQDRGGYLYFDQRGNGSTAWSNQMWIDTTGGVHATTFSGYTLAGACAKSVDTSISAGSTSANLPTSQAVASFVEGKGYITSAPVSSVNGNTGAVTVRELPAVTSSDNGKVLRVVSGAWSAVSLPSASGVSF